MIGYFLIFNVTYRPHTVVAQYMFWRDRPETIRRAEQTARHYLGVLSREFPSDRFELIREV